MDEFIIDESSDRSPAGSEHSSNDNHQDCPTCLDPIDSGLETTLLPCNHKFHTTCLFDANNLPLILCPICRDCSCGIGLLSKLTRENRIAILNEYSNALIVAMKNDPEGQDSEEMVLSIIDVVEQGYTSEILISEAVEYIITNDNQYIAIACAVGAKKDTIKHPKLFDRFVKILWKVNSNPCIRSEDEQRDNILDSLKRNALRCTICVRPLEDAGQAYKVQNWLKNPPHTIDVVCRKFNDEYPARERVVHPCHCSCLANIITSHDNNHANLFDYNTDKIRFECPACTNTCGMSAAFKEIMHYVDPEMEMLRAQETFQQALTVEASAIRLYDFISLAQELSPEQLSSIIEKYENSDTLPSKYFICWRGNDDKCLLVRFVRFISRAQIAQDLKSKVFNAIKLEDFLRETLCYVLENGSSYNDHIIFFDIAYELPFEQIITLLTDRALWPNNQRITYNSTVLKIMNIISRAKIDEKLKVQAFKLLPLDLFMENFLSTAVVGWRRGDGVIGAEHITDAQKDLKEFLACIPPEQFFTLLTGAVAPLRYILWQYRDERDSSSYCEALTALLNLIEEYNFTDQQITQIIIANEIDQSIKKIRKIFKLNNISTKDYRVLAKIEGNNQGGSLFVRIKRSFGYN